MVNFERLEVYQGALHFAGAIYQSTKTFPRNEQFGLVSQMRRASVSIAANIAEGAGRRTNADQALFYGYARGSLFECLPLLHIAHQQGFLTKQTYQELRGKADELIRLINGLLRYLQNPSSIVHRPSTPNV